MNIEDAASLLTKDIEHEDPIVNKFLMPGLGILVAKPKIGKSTLCYNLAIDLSSRDKILNYFKIKQNQSILYLTLEDTESTVKERISSISNNDIKQNSFMYSTTWPFLENLGLEKIDEYLNEHDKTKLVIIDTLQMFSPHSTDSYSGAFDRLRDLRTVAKKYSTCILLVHHQRKYNNVEDIFDNILGSTGFRAMCDSCYIITRRSGQEFEMFIEGRDLEECSYRLKRDEFRFEILGKSEDMNPSETTKIINYIKKKGSLVTLQELYEQFTEKSPSTIRVQCAKLTQDGLLERPYAGTYTLGPYFDYK